MVSRALVILFVLGATWPGLSMMASAAGQVEVHEFASPELEARYRALIDEFRCPKCLNTNLSGSDAPIARDLRRTVRRLLQEEGFGDQQIRDYLRERYGDFVLYDPPFKPGTWILWLAPVAFAIFGCWALWGVLQGAKKDTMTREDHERLDSLLEELE